MSIARLDPQGLRERLDRDPSTRIIDVRTPAEFETAHIPGSHNVPLPLMREHVGQLVGHLDQEIVLVCRSGTRAAQAERILALHGLSNVYVLDGGILAWQQVAQVRLGQPRWDLERQVRLVAGSLVFLFVIGGLLLPGLQYSAAAVGAGLVIAALTKTCVMGNLLSKLPYNRSTHCDLPTVIAGLPGEANR